MKWDDFSPGDFVRLHALDHWEVDDEDDDNADCGFTVEGRIASITTNVIVVDGWWTWASKSAKYTEDQPRETRGRFGVVRGAISKMSILAPKRAYRGA